MTRRTLLKLVALLPFAGPAIAKALAKSQDNLGPVCSRVYAPYLPAGFPKWNKEIDGLEEAGKWALDIERSRLPDGVVFPRAGQIWVAVRDCQVAFRPSFHRPWSQAVTAGPLNDHVWKLLMGGIAHLGQGERICIHGVDDPNKPLRVTFQPVRYQELHQGIVPEGIRETPGYRGYELSLKTAKTIADFRKEQCQTFFNEAFRLVEDAE